MGFREVMLLINIIQQVGRTGRSSILLSPIPEFLLFQCPLSKTGRTRPHGLSSYCVRIAGQWAWWSDEGKKWGEAPSPHVRVCSRTSSLCILGTP